MVVVVAGLAASLHNIQNVMLKVGWKVVSRADEQADIIALDCPSVCLQPTPN